VFRLFCFRGKSQLLASNEDIPPPPNSQQQFIFPTIIQMLFRIPRPRNRPSTFHQARDIITGYMA
jgi:hypothetical protein